MYHETCALRNHTGAIAVTDNAEGSREAETCGLPPRAAKKSRLNCCSPMPERFRAVDVFQPLHEKKYICERREMAAGDSSVQNNEMENGVRQIEATRS